MKKVSTKKATKRTAAKARNYRWHFSFRVGGWRHGYDVHVEVQAADQKRAAIKVRQSIAKMPDVEPFKIHFSEVRKGLPVLESEGHDRKGYCKRKRPVALEFGTKEVHPVLKAPKAKRGHAKIEEEIKPPVTKAKRQRKFRELKPGEVLSKKARLRRAKAYVESLAAKLA